MKFEKQTIKMTVRKIMRKEQLYSLYFSVPSIRSRISKIKKTNIVGPLIWVTSNHYLPTTDGYKRIKDIKIGDSIYSSIDLITK